MRGPSLAVALALTPLFGCEGSTPTPVVWRAAHAMPAGHWLEQGDVVLDHAADADCSTIGADTPLEGHQLRTDVAQDEVVRQVHFTDLRAFRLLTVHVSDLPSLDLLQRGTRVAVLVAGDDGAVTTFGNGECRPGPMLVSARRDDDGVRADLLVPRNQYREVLSASARGSIDLTVFVPTSCCLGSLALGMPASDWIPFDQGLPQPNVTCPWIGGR